MVDLRCAPNTHFHYWHDPLFNQDYQIPESFLDIFRPRLEELDAAVASIRTALKFLPEGHPAAEILAAGLPVAPEEVVSDGVPE